MSDSLKDIKKEFFAMRNGIVADVLRKGGEPYKVIFGLQIPQIAAIAKALPRSMELAEALWNDSDVRESRILATYLFPPSLVDISLAERLVAEAVCAEEADMLSFRLFRNLEFAPQLLERIIDNPERFPHFPPASLKRHLIIED